MSSTSIVFSTIKAHANNKKLDKDPNGYYRVILGALNAYNSSGDFYLADGIKDLIENDSSILSRRLKKGYLNGEMGHPNWVPGMTHDQFISRNLRIEMSNISHHIRELILTPTNKNAGLPGKDNIIKIEAWVKPSGEKGSFLQQAIDNPEQNTAFSIRCLTCDQMINGVKIKKLATIITWDWVVEPGISTANTWDAISIESKDISVFDIDNFKNKQEIMRNLNVSVEDAESIAVSVEETYNSFKKIENCNNLLLNW